MSRLDRETGSGLDITSELTVLTKTLPMAIDDWPLRGAIEVSALTASEGRSLTLRMYANAKLVFESSVPFTSGATAATRTRNLSFKGVQVEAGAAITLSVESDNANDTTAAVDARLNADVEDTPHTWFVDGTHGHDTEHDGRSALTPFVTIGAAVTAAGSGDTISIGPGTWAEAVDLDTANKSLTLRGAGMGKTIISQGAVARTVQLEDHSTLVDMTVISTKAGDGDGVYAGFKENVRLERVWVEGVAHGVNFGSGGMAFIADCYVKGVAFGLDVCSGDYVRITNTIAISTGEWVATNAVALRVGTDGGIISNCYAFVNRGGVGSGDVTGIALNGNLLIRNTRVYAGVTVNPFGSDDARGVVVNVTDIALLDGCAIDTANVDGGAEYDVVQSNGTAGVASTLYDIAKTSGTITHVPPDAAILADTDALEQRVTAGRAAKLDNLDVTVGSRSSHDDPDPSGHIDAAISGRATPADVHVTVTPAYGRQSSRRVGGIIHLPEDSNETLAWHLADSDGKDVDLTGYTGLDLEVYAASGDLLFERTLANGGLVIDNLEHGRVTITFTPDNLATAGTCRYEFWGIQEGGLPTCLARGSLIIEPTCGPTP